MRLLMACLLMIGVMLGGCRSVVAEDASLGSLRQWVDKYPTDKIDGKTFWDNKAFQALAEKLLDARALRDTYGEMGFEIVTPIEIQGDLLRVFVCREHACLMNSATMFVDMKKDKLHICWRNVYDKQDAWLSTGKKPEPMEIGACDKYSGFDLYKNYVKE